MTTVRLATVRDAAPIAQLMQHAYDTEPLALTIYGCDGIADFLQAQMSLPDDLRDTRYAVASESGSVVAFAEFKFAGSDLHLNYICTARERRGGGLARLVLTDGTRIVRQPAHKTFRLDVFADNACARDWYGRLGFTSRSRTAWWRIPLPRSAAAHGTVSGFAQAQACHASYGFSYFSLSTSVGTYSVGRLGSAWFKAAGPDMLDDEEAMASLAALDAGRELLCLAPADFPCERIDGAERLHVAHRMAIDIDNLQRNLTKQGRPT